MLNTLETPIPARGPAADAPSDRDDGPLHDLTPDELRAALARRIRSYYPK